MLAVDRGLIVTIISKLSVPLGLRAGQMLINDGCVVFEGLSKDTKWRQLDLDIIGYDNDSWESNFRLNV